MLSQPFFQVALPIMVTMIVSLVYANSTNNKRLDFNKRLGDLRGDLAAHFQSIERRLERIETLLQAHESRISVLEDRTSPIVHGGR